MTPAGGACRRTGARFGHQRTFVGLAWMTTKRNTNPSSSRNHTLRIRKHPTFVGEKKLDRDRSMINDHRSGAKFRPTPPPSLGAPLSRLRCDISPSICSSRSDFTVCNLNGDLTCDRDENSRTTDASRLVPCSSQVVRNTICPQELSPASSIFPFANEPFIQKRWQL